MSPAGTRTRQALPPSSAGERQPWLDLDVARRPVTDQTERVGAQSCAALLVPFTVESRGTELADHQRLERAASQPEPEEGDARNRIDRGSAQRLAPALEYPDHLRGRELPLERPLAQALRGRCDVPGGIELLHEIRHNSLRLRPGVAAASRCCHSP